MSNTLNLYLKDMIDDDQQYLHVKIWKKKHFYLQIVKTEQPKCGLTIYSLGTVFEII